MSALVAAFRAADTRYTQAVNRYNALSEADRRASELNFERLTHDRLSAAVSLLADAAPRHIVHWDMKVMLTLGDDGQWHLYADDPRHAVFADEGERVDGGGCECEDDDEHDAVVWAAEILPPPTSRELIRALHDLLTADTPPAA